MEMIPLIKLLCKEYNAHVFLVLAFSLVAYVTTLIFVMKAFGKLDKAQAVTNADVKAMSEDVKEIKSGQKEIHATLGQHAEEIMGVKHKMEMTKIELQNKWERYTCGHKKEEASKEEVGVQ